MNGALRLPPLFWPRDADADHGAPILWDFVETDHPWPGQAMRMGDATAFVDSFWTSSITSRRRPTLAIRLDTRCGPTTLLAARAAFASWCVQHGVKVPSTLDVLP